MMPKRFFDCSAFQTRLIHAIISPRFNGDAIAIFFFNNSSEILIKNQSF